MSSFYLFNPVQMLSMVGYGNTSNGRVGDCVEGSSIYSITKEPNEVSADDFKPAQVWTRNKWTVLRLENGDYYHTGEMGSVSGQSSLCKLSDIFKKPYKDIRDIVVADNAAAIITKDSSLYVIGSDSGQKMFPGDTTGEFREEKLPKLEGEAKAE